ncbi:MAG: MFS transporter [Verrucomicrobiales bacterium]|nr:MFS transporter [Verrucomicrobiales bacterium]
MALAAAFLGWLFDGFEMGLFPLIGRPALLDLLHGDAAGEAGTWFSVIIATFLVGAATGGVLFGWLGDRIGRVRAMTLSIFTYAVFTGLCGFATEAWHIAALRFIASLGMGGEWSLGVALVNELWPGRSRAWIAGAIGAAANVGFLLVGLFSLVMLNWVEHWRGWALAMHVPEGVVESLFAHGGWRLLMISGALPALLIFLIRLFVPESDKWEEVKAHGGANHWRAAELGGVVLAGLAALVVTWAWSPLGLSPLPAGIVTLVGLVVIWKGFLHPVNGYLKRAGGSVDPTSARRNLALGAVLAGVALLATWGSVQRGPYWADQLTAGTSIQHAKEMTQIVIAIGAVIGSFLAPLVGDLIGRRPTYTLLCAGALGATLGFFTLNDSYGTSFLAWAGLAGGLSATFYGFFPLYFPELFPTSIRATGQGFCFNVGRVLAAVGGLQWATLMSLAGGDFSRAGSWMCMIYVVGMVVIWFGPETRGRGLQ